MSDFANKNRILEISNPSNLNPEKGIQSNINEELEEKDNIQNTKRSQNNSKIESEEKDINNINNEKEKEKEELELKSEENKNEENKEIILNNSLEKEENKSKEIDNIKNDEIKDENNDENDLNNVNQKEINNNNISKILNLSNEDIKNLVKSGSYLTNLPLSKKEVKNKNQLNNLNIKLPKEAKKTYTNLLEKENSIYSEINSIKQKRENIENYSYELIGPKNIVENNIKSNELKKLKNSENNLMEKLQSIKEQMSSLIINEKKLNRKNNIKEYIDHLNSLEFFNELNRQSKSLASERNKYRQKQAQDLEKAINKKNNELDNKEREQKMKKDEFIKEFRKKEQDIAHKRKLEVDEKMKEAKKYAKNHINFNPDNYLYNRLANQFEEKEKKILDEQRHSKKKVSGIEEISIVKRRIIECKYELEKRRIEKTNEMKNLWHSRSLEVAKYPSNFLKQLKDYENKKLEEEEKQKIKITVLNKMKERYVKENVSLPPISEKLRNEREKRQITFLSMEGRERVKCIKNEIDKKVKNKYSAIEGQILQSIENKKSDRNNRSKSSEKKQKFLIKSASEANILKFNKIKIMKRNRLSPIKLNKKRPNEINYLEQLRKKRIIYSNNYIDWNKEIKNIKDDNGASIYNIKKRIEYMDEKYKMEKDLIQAKGGYVNNQEMGNNMNNMIINSISGKLVLLENLNP